ncbi:MAG: enoyl-CoA hydratase, partial [Oceanospirillaceae bacterium]
MTANKDKTTTQLSTQTEPEMILVERREQVGLITLNRPKQLNALNRQLANETLTALRAFDADP